MMGNSSSSLLDRMRVVKNLSPADQCGLVRRIAKENARRGGEIRKRLEHEGSRGIKISVDLSDFEVVVLALASAIAHDVATLPDDAVRRRFMKQHGEVIREIGASSRDALYFRERFSSYCDLLA